MNVLRCPTRAHAVRLASGLIVAAALLASFSAHAQWKWRDAQGRITASDLPPPREVPEKDILQRPNLVARAAPVPAAAAASGAASAVAAVPPRAPAADKELEARKRAAEQQAQAKNKAEEERIAAARADNCRRARGQLAALDSGQRIFRINDRGEREVLDDAARAAESRRAREVVGSDCR